MARNKSEGQISHEKVREQWDAIVQSCPLLFRDADSYSFSCGPGWHDLLKELCTKIEAKLQALPEDELNPIDWDEKPTRRYYVQQIKEKFATLRFYMDYEPEWADELISIAEGRSAKTCETCGEPGEPRNLSWLKTLCEEHYQETLRRRDEMRDRNRQSRAAAEAAKKE